MTTPDKPLTLKLFFQRLHSLHPLSTGLRDYLNEVMEIKFIKKHTQLLKPGQVPKHIYFIESEVIRCYIRYNDKDISMAFRKEGDLVASMGSFQHQTSSPEYFCALEDCIVYSLSFDQYRTLCKEFPEFNFHIWLLMERNYQLAEECLKIIKTLNAHERYAWLTERLPDLSQRVSAKYLASYLGISEGMLSTIKSRK